MPNDAAFIVFAFIGGVFMGAAIGVFVMALCVAAGKD